MSHCLHGVCVQVTPCLHNVSVIRCPPLYMMYLCSGVPLFTCIQVPHYIQAVSVLSVPLFTGCICIQVFYCLRAVSVFRRPTVYICVQASHYLQAASVFRCPTIYMLHLSSGVPLFTRDSGSVLNILSAVDLSTVHVPKGRQRHHTTFINHTGREFWFLHFTLDLDAICVVRKTHT